MVIMSNEKVILPSIRPEYLPSLKLEDILGVQPMTSPKGEIFSMRLIGKDDASYSDGDWMHDFVEGWKVRYGDQWIDPHTYFDIKVAGL